MKIFLSAILFIVVTQAILPAQIYHFNKLTVEEGLNDGDMHAIGQDKYGYMWFGSLGGLSRFNGRNMEWFTHVPGDTSSIPGSLALSMALDSSGRLWIAFETGLVEYRYGTSSFRRVAAAGETRIDKLLPVGKRKLYMATDKGLGVMDVNTGMVKYYRDVAKDPEQKEWFRTRVFSMASHGDLLYLSAWKGIFVFDTVTERLEKIDIPQLKGVLTSSVAVDSRGNLWLGSYGRIQLLKIPLTGDYQKEAGQKAVSYDRFFSSSEKIINNNVNAIETDIHGKIWVATSIDGLLEYMPETDSFRQHVHKPELKGSPSGDLHRCMFRDRDGLIWLGGNQGMNYFNPARTFFTTIMPFSRDLDTRHRRMARDLTEDRNGNLWFATLDGVSSYSPETGAYTEWNNRLGQPAALWNNSVRGIHRDKKGDIWIATGGGINRFSTGQRKMEFIGNEVLPTVFYFGISEDRKGRLWFCGRDKDGFYWYDPDTDSSGGISAHRHLKVFSGLGGRYFMEDSKGRYWLGTNGGGLGMYDPSAGRTRLWTTGDSTPVISGNKVIEIREDRLGWVWVSTDLGITGISPDLNHYRTFTAKTGLPANTTAALRIDSLDRIWVGTTRGITMIDSSRSMFTTFGVRDGLPAATFYEHSGYRAVNGDFIFPSVNGYVRFDPLKFREDNSPLRCYLSEVRVLNEKYPVKGEPSELKQLRFRPDENTFTLELTALHYENPGQVWYAFKLDGFDKEWTYTQQYRAHYTRVPGGNYTFRYKATVNPAGWDVPENVLAITVDTVFYKTAWFLTLIVLMAGMLLYGVYRYRLQQQQQMLELRGKSQMLEKEKALVMYENLKQQLNPHFLFNSLTSLRSLIRGRPEMAGDFLDGLSRIYRYILKNREKETVLLSEEISFTETYIKLQQTRFPRGFYVNMRIRPDCLDRKIAPVTLQNLVENAIKHNLIDAESPLVVNIFTKDNYIIVENNLQPKEFVETSNRQGLQHLHSLYAYLSDQPLAAGSREGFYRVKVPLIGGETAE
ncbi:hypothetical protein GCM10023091_19360 [Ravibacter arvi]|uniref:Two component regulator with propeller domain n=1 Tax=Ravibacter arvi TaxID=2051041 RepID=A0ABP8LY90_9BACT